MSSRKVKLKAKDAFSVIGMLTFAGVLHSQTGDGGAALITVACEQLGIVGEVAQNILQGVKL